jgi:hypothetical protein
VVNPGRYPSWCGTRALAPSRGFLVRRIVLAQGAVLLLLIAGVSLLLLTGGGLYWLVPAVLLCMLDAVLDAWVLLVEILR